MRTNVWRLPTVMAAVLMSAAVGRAATPPPAATPPASVPHTFRYAPPAGTAPPSVAVAGDFNGWSTTASPMARGADGAYTATVRLPAGPHQYKFVCGDQWVNDPAADPALAVDDGQQGKNSVVDVTPGPPAAAPARAPPHTFRYVPPAGAAATVVVAGDFNGWSTTANPMARGTDGTYTAPVDVPAGVHHYKFVCDGKWMQDPTANPALDADDGNGGTNSGVLIGPPAGK